MIVEQIVYVSPQTREIIRESNISEKAQMVLVFAAKELIKSRVIFESLRSRYPKAYILGCSTAGEIFKNQVADNTLTATAVYFEKTTVRFASAAIQDRHDCYNVAVHLAQQFSHAGLTHVFILSEGLNINGSRLVAGFRNSLPVGVTITGGLSGDNGYFEETYVLANDYAQKNLIAAVAFYGANIKVGYGSVGGWDSFGIERTVTKSSQNILYELDGKPVLDLYKEYLGERSKDLPMSALYFPLHIRSKDGKFKSVRTILGVDVKKKSLVFAGDIPEGYYAKLMKANIHRLINGAMEAAENCLAVAGAEAPKLAVLISCVGRKLILKQLTDDEIDITREVLGEETVYTGFYSYGEISRENPQAQCELHNQTMTITTFDEV